MKCPVYNSTHSASQWHLSLHRSPEFGRKAPHAAWLISSRLADVLHLRISFWATTWFPNSWISQLCTTIFHSACACLESFHWPSAHPLLPEIWVSANGTPWDVTAAGSQVGLCKRLSSSKNFRLLLTNTEALIQLLDVCWFLQKVSKCPQKHDIASHFLFPRTNRPLACTSCRGSGGAYAPGEEIFTWHKTTANTVWSPGILPSQIPSKTSKKSYFKIKT